MVPVLSIAQNCYLLSFHSYTTIRRILFILIRYIDDRMQEGCMD